MTWLPSIPTEWRSSQQRCCQPMPILKGGAYSFCCLPKSFDHGPRIHFETEHRSYSYKRDASNSEVLITFLPYATEEPSSREGRLLMKFFRRRSSTSRLSHAVRSDQLYQNGRRALGERWVDSFETMDSRRGREME